MPKNYFESISKIAIKYVDCLVTISPKKIAYLCSNACNKLNIWDMQENKEVSEINLNNFAFFKYSHIQALEILPNGFLVFACKRSSPYKCASYETDLIIFDVESLRILKVISNIWQEEGGAEYRYPNNPNQKSAFSLTILSPYEILCVNNSIAKSCIVDIFSSATRKINIPYNKHLKLEVKKIQVSSVFNDAILLRYEKFFGLWSAWCWFNLKNFNLINIPLDQYHKPFDAQECFPFNYEDQRYILFLDRQKVILHVCALSHDLQTHYLKTLSVNDIHLRKMTLKNGFFIDMQTGEWYECSALKIFLQHRHSAARIAAIKNTGFIAEDLVDYVICPYLFSDDEKSADSQTIKLKR